MKLGALLTAYRQKNDLSVRAMASQIGVSPATFNRIERGEECDMKTFAKLLHWMMTP